MSRRFALVAALAALLVMPGSASATVKSVTVSGNTKAFMNSSPTIALGDSVQWQAFATTLNHTTTADKFTMWTYNLPAGTETTPMVVFDRAGGFAYHCTIHPSMHGTVLVQMYAEDPTPVVGQVITIHFAMSAAPTGFSEQIQKRKVGGTWKNFSVGNTGAIVNWTPSRARTFQFQARLVRGATTSNWSPILSLTVTAH